MENGVFTAWWSCEQSETFAKPKTQQEIVNSPSFPRRRESWLSLCNKLFLRRFLNIKQDSRLRGNDGIFYFSGCCWGFCKGFSLKFNLSSKKKSFGSIQTVLFFRLSWDWMIVGLMMLNCFSGCFWLHANTQRQPERVLCNGWAMVLRLALR